MLNQTSRWKVLNLPCKWWIPGCDTSRSRWKCESATWACTPPQRRTSGRAFETVAPSYRPLGPRSTWADRFFPSESMPARRGTLPTNTGSANQIPTATNRRKKEATVVALVALVAGRSRGYHPGRLALGLHGGFWFRFGKGLGFGGEGRPWEIFVLGSRNCAKSGGIGRELWISWYGDVPTTHHRHLRLTSSMIR